MFSASLEALRHRPLDHSRVSAGLCWSRSRGPSSASTAGRSPRHRRATVSGCSPRAVRSWFIRLSSRCSNAVRCTTRPAAAYDGLASTEPPSREPAVSQSEHVPRAACRIDRANRVKIGRNASPSQVVMAPKRKATLPTRCHTVPVWAQSASGGGPTDSGGSRARRPGRSPAHHAGPTRGNPVDQAAAATPKILSRFTVRAAPQMPVRRAGRRPARAPPQRPGPDAPLPPSPPPR